MKYKTIQIKALLIERDIPESDVPCRTVSCTECCEKLSPYLTEDEVRSGKYIYTFLTSGDPEKPVIAIPRTDHGCLYLSFEKTCTIYNHRPLACRQFDCRQNHSPIITNKFLGT